MVIPTLSSSLGNRENIAVGRTTDVVDNVDAAGEPALAVWSLDKSFEQSSLCGNGAGPHCWWDLFEKSVAVCKRTRSR